MSKSSTGPLLLTIPVLSTAERVLQTALHLLKIPEEPTFVGQVAATDPFAAPMPVLFSFPVCCFDARRPHHPPQQTLK